MTRGETTQLPLYEFVVTYADSPSSTTAVIRACYMQEEGRFVVFKDRAHGVVFAVNGDALVAVRRESLPEAPERAEVKESAPPVRDSYDQARFDLLDHGRSSR